MKDRELREIIRTAAVKKDIAGVMQLTELCDLSYERVRRVWDGQTSTKLSDVLIVTEALGIKLKFIINGDS